MKEGTSEGVEEGESIQIKYAFYCLHLLHLRFRGILRDSDFQISDFAKKRPIINQFISSFTKNKQHCVISIKQKLIYTVKKLKLGVLNKSKLLFIYLFFNLLTRGL